MNTVLTISPSSPLTPKQMRRIEAAVAIVFQHGWGTVSVVIVKGRVVGIKTEISEALTD